MDGVKHGMMSRGLRSDEKSRRLQDCGGSAEAQCKDGPKQAKSRSGHEFLGLSRCAACYNPKASSMSRRGDGGESSSSAEDSGPEMDYESEAESSSSSNTTNSGPVEAETAEQPETEGTPERAEAATHSPGRGDAAQPESREEDGDGREEAGGTSEAQRDTNGTKGTVRRAPFIKSYSLPSSFTPHLTPFSLLPRPARVVSTLNLQVLSEKHNNADDTFFTIRQHLSGREDRKTGERYGGGGGRLGSVNNPWLPPPFQPQRTGLPWQHRSLPTLWQHRHQQQQQQMPYQYQHQHQQNQHQHQQQQLPYQYQQPQPFPPLSAQGQGLPPSLHTLPVFPPPMLHAPQPHLHALAPQPCWHCYRMLLPYTYWNQYAGGQLHR